MNKAAERFLSHLDGVRSLGSGRWLAKCPSHDDRTPSLSITQTDDRVLVHDHAGCSVDAVMEAMGLRTADLFDNSCPRQLKLDRQADLEQRAWSGLEDWRQVRLTECCQLIRGLESLADDVHRQLGNHGADFGIRGFLGPEDHGDLLDMLRLCYHALPTLEREFQLLNSASRVDHLTAWRESRRADAVTA